MSVGTGPVRLEDKAGSGPLSPEVHPVSIRQIELVPGERVVQAWRFGDAHPDVWDPGVYSIVRFTLTAEGDQTRFVVDHDAIPAEWHEHIEAGYPIFYQEPMTSYFAKRSAANHGHLPSTGRLTLPAEHEQSQDQAVSSTPARETISVQRSSHRPACQQEVKA
jgi:hypothetical protein